jgi:hypothetical protein
VERNISLSIPCVQSVKVFVDIGGIVDHHYLNFLKVRGDCMVFWGDIGGIADPHCLNKR